MASQSVIPFQLKPSWKIEELESKYDKQFAVIFEAIKQLIHEKNKPRNLIGFKVKK